MPLAHLKAPHCPHHERALGARRYQDVQAMEIDKGHDFFGLSRRGAEEIGTGLAKIAEITFSKQTRGNQHSLSRHLSDQNSPATTAADMSFRGLGANLGLRPELATLKLPEAHIAVGASRRDRVLVAHRHTKNVP